MRCARAYQRISALLYYWRKESNLSATILIVGHRSQFRCVSYFLQSLSLVVNLIWTSDYF